MKRCQGTLSSPSCIAVSSGSNLWSISLLQGKIELEEALKMFKSTPQIVTHFRDSQPEEPKDFLSKSLVGNWMFRTRSVVNVNAWCHGTLSVFIFAILRVFFLFVISASIASFRRAGSIFFFAFIIFQRTMCEFSVSFNSTFREDELERLLVVLEQNYDIRNDSRLMAQKVRRWRFLLFCESREGFEEASSEKQSTQCLNVDCSSSISVLEIHSIFSYLLHQDLFVCVEVGQELSVDCGVRLERARRRRPPGARGRSFVRNAQTLVARGTHN